jgi:prepilin-type N-terminal cleavage/methylation domain-containing protein
MKNKGFTLIELLVVVAIISMLTSVTLSSLNDAKQKGRDTGRIRALQEVRKALQLYATEKGGFPCGVQGGGNTYLNTPLISGGYIPNIDSSIIYSALESDNVTYCRTTCSTDPRPCPSYHLAVILERRDNGVLRSDKDLDVPTGPPGARLYGKNDTCKSTADNSSLPDLCYDLIP